TDLLFDRGAAELGSALLVRRKGDVQLAAAGFFPPSEQLDERFASHFTLLEKVLQIGEPLATSNARSDLARFKQHGVRESGIAALACAPLQSEGRTVAALLVDTRRPAAGVTHPDAESLEAA